MAVKGGKGLLAAKSIDKDKDKNKKKAPVSRSSRAGLQVPSRLLFPPLFYGSSHPYLERL
jgi:hypothetical protein